jgi:hypothetical protein
VSPASPPTWLADARSADEAATGRRAAKAARRMVESRAVLAQCQRCLVNGTAVVAGDRVLSMNLAALRHGQRLAHAGCGGSFALFDIEVDG